MTTLLTASSKTNDILKDAGLDFEVYQLPVKAIYEPDENSILGGESFEIATNKVANVRLNLGMPKVLGIVGENYTLVQNKDAFRIFDPFFENGLAVVENAGEFFGGKKVFIQAKLNMDGLDIVPGDEILPYILLAHSFDGSLAVHFGFTPQRVVCHNTLMRACQSKSSRLWKIRHKGDVINNLEQIRDTFNLLNQEFIFTAEQYQRLAKISMNSDQFKQYIKKVFNTKQELDLEEESSEDEIKERKSRVIEALEKAYVTSPGADIPGVSGTAWAAYNAVTWYLQNERGNRNTTQEKRLDSVWFGDANRINAKALKEALALV